MSIPALILIDIQEGFKEIAFFGTERNNLDAEVKASELLHLWRRNKGLIIHIQHNSQNLSSPLHKANSGFQFQPSVLPHSGEHTFEKTVNSAFIGTNLKEVLDAHNIRQLVIVGLTTDHCVSTTTRMAANFGYAVTLVSDATATFDRVGIQGEHYTAEQMHFSALASLNNEFASIKTCQEVIEMIENFS